MSTGWSTSDFTDPTFSYQEIADEFWGALRERKLAMGMASDFVPAAGANIQIASDIAPSSPTGNFSLRYMQEWIFTYSYAGHDGNYFTRTYGRDGTSRGSDFYHHSQTLHGITLDGFLPTWASPGRLMWSVRAMRTSSPNSSDQIYFRAATEWPSDWTDWSDAAYVENGRYAEKGDIIGPWIFQDIQDCFNMLVWTQREGVWSNEGEDNKHIGTGYVIEWPGPLTYSDAAVKAESDWDASPDISDATGTPLYWTQYWLNSGYEPKRLSAVLHRKYSYLTAIVPYISDVKRDIDWYISATRGSLSDVFANGSDIDFWSEYIWSDWNLFDRDSPAAASSDFVTGRTIGEGVDPLSTKPEPWPSVLPGAGDSGPAVGWYRKGDTVLIRWNVTSGFTYT